MSSVRLATRLVLLGTSLISPSLLTAQASPKARSPEHSAATPSAELPRTYVGKPTTAAITAADLMTRLYIFADDSMMGRQVGTEYNLKGTAYIEREVRRLGLVPAGDSGTYFQNIPLYTYAADTTAMVHLGSEMLAFSTDFFPMARAERKVVLDGTPVIYGGVASDTSTWISGEQATGKVVVFGLPASAAWFRNPLLGPAALRFSKAAAIMPVFLDRMPANVKAALARRTALQVDGAPPAGPVSAFITPRVATLLFGNMDSVKAGMPGKALSGSIVVHESQAPGRNVVAILPGSDPVLKNEYVAIGAHNDHIGFNGKPVDHDSIRVFNMVMRPQGADSPQGGPPTAEQASRMKFMVDSLHALHGARKDSISNGADDDGSGSVSVLEIAEAFAKAKARPKRSLLFVWHTGEEAGLYGSQHFTDHPTVPRDSIVAQLNMDMVGRGAAADITGETKEHAPLHGGPGYLQIVGSRRLSTELGDLIEKVNAEKHLGMKFDYGMDANGHPQNIYCRSDHYEYARYGIPVAFFTTGGHSDYHQVTDEPQYIDYGHMAQVATLVHDAAWAVANLDHRVVVDKAKPDPKGRCVQ